MRILNGSILFAAHDLDRFLACSHGTFLDIRNLQESLPKSQEDEQLRLLERFLFQNLRASADGQSGFFN
jgi:hypothetical protein